MRTQSSHGLIFYVANKDEDQFMKLFVSRGYFVYTFSNGHKKMKIKSLEKYNDGLWHNVSLTHENNTGRLIIDGQQALKNSLHAPLTP